MANETDEQRAGELLAVTQAVCALCGCFKSAHEGDDFCCPPTPGARWTPVEEGAADAVAHVFSQRIEAGREDDLVTWAGSVREAEIILTRLASPSRAKGEDGPVARAAARDWVDCPICGEPDMRRETDSEGYALIFCVNHSCPSNTHPATPKPEAVEALVEREKLRAEIINTPETADFMAAVPIEAAHQRDRWGTDHDAGKTAFDWFWLIGYLAQKAAAAEVAGHTEKALHHTISTAAALANWHAALTGASTTMRPGTHHDNVAAGILTGPGGEATGDGGER